MLKWLTRDCDVPEKSDDSVILLDVTHSQFFHLSHLPRGAQATAFLRKFKFTAVCDLHNFDLQSLFAVATRDKVGVHASCRPRVAGVVLYVSIGVLPRFSVISDFPLSLAISGPYWLC